MGFMFNVGGGEVIVILLLALLLLGPEKLPEVARKVGKTLADIRRVTSGFEEEVRTAMDLGKPQVQENALDRMTPGPTLITPITDPTTGPTSFNGGAATPFVADLGAEDETTAK